MFIKSLWSLLLLVSLEKVNSAVDHVVFTGEQYKQLFTEAKESDNQKHIDVYLNDSLLPDNAQLALNGGWYIERVIDRVNSSVRLKNDMIKYVTPDFEVKIAYASRAQEVLSFYVLNASATDDFTLSTSPEKVSFTLWCMYNASKEESLQEMFWAIQTGAKGDGYVMVNSSSDGTVLVNSAEKSNNTILLTMFGAEDLKRFPHGVSEPLTAYSATVLANALDYTSYFDGSDILPQLLSNSTRVDYLHLHAKDEGSLSLSDCFLHLYCDVMMFPSC